MLNSRSVLLVTLTTLAASLIGCGSGISPMDSAQKDRFRTTLGHLASVTDALVSGSPSMVHRLSKRHAPVNAALKAMASMKSTSSEKQQIEKALNDAISSGACKESDNVPSQGDIKAPITITLAGDNCPIAFTFAINGSASKTDIDLQVDVEYAVKSDDFRKLADVDGISFKGSIKGNGGQQVGAAIQVDLEGNFHSVSEKDLGVYVKANIGSSRDGDNVKVDSELSFGVKYPDFTGELKVTNSTNSGTTSQENHYFVNEEEVSQSEFDSYLKDFSSASSYGKVIGRN